MTELAFNSLRRLESITVFTAFGIHFWDPVGDRPIRDGLKVTARPLLTSRPVVDAFRTTSGIYAFRGLPGLRTIENLADEEQANEESPPNQIQYMISVTDQLERFMPLAFSVDLPLPYDGVYRPTANHSTPASNPPRFYLPSAPTRSATTGLAAVRAQLVEYIPGSLPVDERKFPPVVDVILEVEIARKKWWGLADERGMVNVLLPYPTFSGGLLTSPPGLGLGGLLTSPPGKPPSEQEWDLTVRARYSGTLQAPVKGKRIDFFQIWNQSGAGIWPTKAGPPVDEWQTQLTFGQELVLRTEDQRCLWISPGGSPP